MDNSVAVNGRPENERMTSKAWRNMQGRWINECILSGTGPREDGVVLPVLPPADVLDRVVLLSQKQLH